TLVVAALVLHLASRFRRAVGGFTGDFLGATEQLSEIALLLVAVLLFSNVGPS
ncbi:MAG: adenosylcobinamide-GDP ribazoletransferase, partial [Deltaproteobacteria bacterium]|nr:adenosylcobinamide-GDP ribazoletransferase [Deltaproteobacteria bacterium]